MLKKRRLNKRLFFVKENIMQKKILILLSTSVLLLSPLAQSKTEKIAPYEKMYGKTLPVVIKEYQGEVKRCKSKMTMPTKIKNKWFNGLDNSKKTAVIKYIANETTINCLSEIDKEYIYALINVYRKTDNQKVKDVAINSFAMAKLDKESVKKLNELSSNDLIQLDKLLKTFKNPIDSASFIKTNIN